ncbi:murB: UDP-N-acetylenolpyruvoylglucosamine reductase [Rubrobacter radiotolerans]|uniref:UDP-N-acetylenolpyruvoylglucosamine reductase n=1 Tax=Rubrobacter radiotolerans TaxID=42256 RepID=A0A023X5I4_RUBRA|nr:UDP-N-acetylmuramate dehydrogenase [Rubrobacter radiotolerans]AHY47732.1 murB: UDP-N-acetylenolpyruvoylglucosamine reductase [Rubrobacter radiotolerans]MDX5895135.1 UDP-N-acetylmuramate dehydrogenase [Rubrobacter radiotolerans]SMC07515.1 UDP-N-acetylmuramate dehydrogenase [Rubrobacter radiotolerans DSM 5868]
MSTRTLHHLFPSAKLDEPLSRYTAWKIGGPADALLEPKSVDELVEAVRTAREKGVPVTVLGGGTNVLVRDGGIRGLVIRLAKSLKGVEFDAADGDGPVLTAEAGALYPVLANAAASRGLAGMEFATGIPGTVGGAVYMNAGAYGSETREVMISADILRDGEVVPMTSADLKQSYRYSILHERPDWTVLRARYRLSPGDPEEMKARIKEYRAQRMTGSPSKPSCGSTFKRPPGDFPGRVIEEAGLKGTTIGNIQVSPVHANYFVNLGGAKAEDALAMIEHVKKTVKERLGIDLELEVRIIGEPL